MKRTGAQLARFALEQLRIQHTFGIPGVHNTELYDELHLSTQIQPHLVTHEGAGAFLADAISRTSEQVGTLLIVPAAGVTHAASGIGEAFLAGIPLLVISGGIHSNSPYSYQLHEMDQHALLRPITKATYKIIQHEQVIPTLYRAYQRAIEGEPGPVFVELPYNISNFIGTVKEQPTYTGPWYQHAPMHVSEPTADKKQHLIELAQQAAQLLVQSKQVGLFVGWGAMDCHDVLTELATWLDAPVATSLQGLSAFPAHHPLHTGMGYGKYSVPAAEQAFADIDALLAIGVRFAEIPTGSFSMKVPQRLLHIDINPQVFQANYPADWVAEADARAILPLILDAVKAIQPQPKTSKKPTVIQAAKQAYLQEWLAHTAPTSNALPSTSTNKQVNPAAFLQALRRQLADDAIVVVDDGNHTYLTAELLPIYQNRGFISPTDFNAMGYCVPAAIGARLVQPEKQVVGIVGDGSFLMTAMELLSAVQQQLGLVICIFNDGELSQISQAQEIPYYHKPCTTVAPLNHQAYAQAIGAHYIGISHSEACEDAIQQALTLAAQGQVVLVDVHVDYSKRTRFTQGVVQAKLKTFARRDKTRIISRAIWRRLRHKKTRHKN